MYPFLSFHELNTMFMKYFFLCQNLFRTSQFHKSFLKICMSALGTSGSHRITIVIGGSYFSAQLHFITHTLT